MAIDVDHSGTIQKEEIQFLFDTQNFKITEQQLQAIFDSLYIHENDSITFLEFEAGVLGREFFSDEERLKTMFKYFDLDGNGHIESEEISDCFKRFGRNLR